MTATLTDIARKAGVSRATAARALSGRQEVRRSALARAQRIRRIAEQLGYRPNAAAKAISTGRFKAIALVLSDRPGRGYLPDSLLRGIHDALAERGMHLTYVRLSDEQFTDAGVLPDVLVQFAVDGLMINYISDVPPGLAELIERFRIPAIWLNHRREHDCVYPDEFDAGERLTRHLLGLGHRDVVYVGPGHEHPGSHFSSGDRFAGYRSAMTQAGLSPRHINMDLGASQAREQLDVHHDARRVISELTPPAAVLAYDAQRAVPLLYAAARLGREVPGDLSLATFDASRRNEIGYPLTSTALPEDAGAQAVELMQRKIEQPDQLLPPVVLKRRFFEGCTAGPRFAPDTPDTP